VITRVASNSSSPRCANTRGLFQKVVCHRDEIVLNAEFPDESADLFDGAGQSDQRRGLTIADKVVMIHAVTTDDLWAEVHER
jgi:hypothetical protein